VGQRPRAPKIGTVVAALAALLLGGGAAARDMTHARAINPGAEPQNWINHAWNYAGWRHSPLAQINRRNVANLRPVFSLVFAGVEGAGRYANGSLEATPLIEDGYAYFPNGWGTVFKVDVRSGTQGEFIWALDPATERAWAADIACCQINNRGVALWKDKVISVTLDGRLLAIEKDTGELAWERKLADPAVGETLTVAPLVVRDLAIVGPAGAEYGIRGWLEATDLATGKPKWRTYTVAGPGDTNIVTWADNYRAWETGGGSIYVTGTYDADLNVMYWGTGNPGPDWDSEYRPGDNLYTDSLLAMTPETGQMRWHFQYTPNDPFDYDEASEHQIIDAEIDGAARKLVVHAARNGFYYAFDRLTGAFLFGRQYVDLVSWTDGLDPKTGRPRSYDPTKEVQAYKPGSTGRRSGAVGTQCPLISGGKNWEPAAYNPQTGLLYVQAGEGCSQRVAIKQDHPVGKGGTVKPRDRFVGGGAPQTPGPTSYPLVEHGALKAIRVTTGETVAKVYTEHFDKSGVLSTDGGLVFAGSFDGSLRAYDALTLERLWSYNGGTAIKAPPIAYSVDGREYIAVLAGAAVGNTQKRASPRLLYYVPTHMLYVFSL